MRAQRRIPLLVACVAAMFGAGGAAAAGSEYNWNAGNFSDQSFPATLPEQALLNMNAPGATLTFNVGVTNQGVARWLNGALAIANGVTVVNQGTFEIQTNNELKGTSAAAPFAGTFNNSGTVRKFGAPGVTAFRDLAGFVNSGILEAVQSSHRFDYGVSGQTFNAGTAFAGAGEHWILNNANFNGTFSSNDRVLFDHNGIFHGGNAGFTGAIRFVRGTLTGQWTVQDGGSLAMQGDMVRVLSGATVLNQGDISLDSGGLRIEEGSILNNAGTMELKNNATLFRAFGTGAVTNRGTIKKTGATNTTGFILASVEFENAADGKLLVETGTLQVQAFGQNAGTIETLSGASFVGTVNLTNTGLIKGSGRIQITNNGQLINSGTINPGNSPGPMLIEAGFSQTADGTLIIEIESLASFDQLNIIGAATLGGTLEIHRIGDYKPAVGHSFEILTSTGTLSGEFAGTPILVGFGKGVEFGVLYDHGLKSVTLQVTAIPEPETWALMGIGLGLVGWAARRRARAASART